MSEKESDPVFVSMEVKRIREFIDCDCDTLGRDVIRREIHKMLDRVCEASDEQYSRYQKHLEKQGEVMAETARQNVRLRDALNRISLITVYGGTVEHECIYKIASEALKGANRD